MKQTTELSRTRRFNSIIKSLCYKKPSGVSYYQLALSIFLSPVSNDKKKLIILDALKEYHNSEFIHVKLGLLAKTYVEYYNSNFTYKHFMSYIKFYQDKIIID